MTSRLILFPLCCLILVGRPLPLRSQAKLLRIETSIDAMGGSFSIIAYGPDAYKLRAAAEAAGEEVRRLEQVMSNYIADSEWSQINRDGSKGPVRVSAETVDLIQACKNYHRLSGGTFDISVGPLMKVWGFYKGTGRLPHRAEVREALQRVGSDMIEIDAKARTVRFQKSGMEIDPGGIGKGFAVDRAAAILREYGIDTALISAARSSIMALGAPPNESGWRVQIRDPKDAAKIAQEVVLRDESMSTSGNYEKFFYAAGKLYSHIMDPRTGFPAQGMLSVSVIAPACIDSEAWTKPIYIQGRTWAEQHKPTGFRAFVCEDKPAVRGPFGPQGERTSCVWLR